MNMMPSPYFTPEHDGLRSELERFARAELNDDMRVRDAEHSFATGAWKKCAAMGVQGLCVPEEYGGGGADALTIVVAMEALGYGCTDNGLLFSLNAQMWSCQTPLVRFGNDEQKLRYLPGLCDGSLIGVQGMTEPDSGSDAFGMRTSAVLDGDDWVLNGSKTFITNAPVAGVFVVFAVTDPALAFAGISAFLVERDTPGLTIGAPFRKMGLRTSPMSELAFTDCRVPAHALLGKRGGGMAIFNHSMDWERSCIMASAVGTMRRQLEQAAAYANTRKQFGQPIGRFQAVSHTLVDMRLRLESARLMLFNLGWLKATGRSTPMESAMVKLLVSEAYLQSSLDSLQVHGALGYMEETEVERDIRDAIGARIYSGTSQIQRNIIAGHMGL